MFISLRAFFQDGVISSFMLITALGESGEMVVNKGEVITAPPPLRVGFVLSGFI